MLKRLSHIPPIKLPGTRNLLGDLLKESEHIKAAEPVTEKGQRYPSKSSWFSFFFTENTFSDSFSFGRGFGGSGPSPGVLKRLSHIPPLSSGTRNLLGNLLKESEHIKAAEPVTEKGQRYPSKNGRFSFFLRKFFFQTHLVSVKDLGVGTFP